MDRERGIENKFEYRLVDAENYTDKELQALIEAPGHKITDLRDISVEVPSAPDHKEEVMVGSLHLEGTEGKAILVPEEHIAILILYKPVMAQRDIWKNAPEVLFTLEKYGWDESADAGDREMATRALSLYLGLDVSSPVTKKFDEQTGKTVSIRPFYHGYDWVSASIELPEEKVDRLFRNDQYKQIAVLNYITGKLDPNAFNMLVTETDKETPKLRTIDESYTFPTNKLLLAYSKIRESISENSSISGAQAGMQVSVENGKHVYRKTSLDESMIDTLKKALEKQDEISELLKTYKIPDASINDMFWRIKYMLELNSYITPEEGRNLVDWQTKKEQE